MDDVWQFFNSLNNHPDSLVWLNGPFKWAQIALCLLMMVVGLCSISSVRWMGAWVALLGFTSALGVYSAGSLFNTDFTTAYATALVWLVLVGITGLMGTLTFFNGQHQRLGASIAGLSILMTIAPLMTIRLASILSLRDLPLVDMSTWDVAVSMLIGSIMVVLPGVNALVDYGFYLAERREIKVVGRPWSYESRGGEHLVD